MLNILNLIIIILFIIIGSVILFFAIFGTRLLNFHGNDKVEIFRQKYNTVIFSGAIILLIGAFSLMVFHGNNDDTNWTKEQKEEMVRKIMEGSIFIHGIGADTARLVSECFINKYTGMYTPRQMREQNKMSNEDISRLTSAMMIECLRKFGLPLMDTTAMQQKRVEAFSK